MTTYFTYSFGGYTFNAGDLTSIQESPEYRERASSSAGRGGRYSAGSLFDCLHIDLQGDILGSDTEDPGTLQASWDALAAAFPPGQARVFRKQSDRYCRAEVRSFGEAQAWKGKGARYFSIGLTSNDDPPWFADAVTTQGLATTGDTTFNALGGGAADPILTLVFSAAPAGGIVTISNAAGETFTFDPDATGTYVFSTLDDTILRAGVDKYAGLISGELLRLSPGSNTWTITLGNGATLSSASLNYQARYY
ncbi:MAG: hypothetical protein ABIY70_09110 [Capsulimonas sp.]|uniref:hypothetical protein n=1 Tax=Capsulimonas sp. TaxID=2494211 RepID=UPI0032654A9D